MAIAELETHSPTSPLPPQVQELLHTPFPIDPELGQAILGNILEAPLSLEIYQSLAPIIPNLRLDFLEQAVTTALKKGHLSVLALIKAYPTEEITLNLTPAIAFALQFNRDYWQSRLLEPLLRRDLSRSQRHSITEITLGNDPTQPTEAKIYRTSLSLNDQERQRTIPVDLYWTRDTHASTPLVVISHGFGSDRFYLASLASHLASHGLTVAAIEHPRSNLQWLIEGADFTQLATLVPPQEFIDRPQDITFLLDRLAPLHHQPGLFQGKLNTEQVTLIGHSLGGYTALVLAGARLNLPELRRFCRETLPLSRSPGDWLQCAAAQLRSTPNYLKDDRIAQVIAISPLIGQLFGKTGMSDVNKPTLILSNTHDLVTPAIAHQIRPFSRLSGSKYLLTAIGAPHLSVGNLKNTSPSSQLQPLQKVLNALSLALIKQLTPEKEQYQAFLTPGYAQSFSTPQLPLYFQVGDEDWYEWQTGGAVFLPAPLAQLPLPLLPPWPILMNLGHPVR